MKPSERIFEILEKMKQEREGILDINAGIKAITIYLDEKHDEQNKLYQCVRTEHKDGIPCKDCVELSLTPNKGYK